MPFLGRTDVSFASFRESAHPATTQNTAPLVKVALVGDSQVGKTSLMVRYVEGGFDETQLQTQGTTSANTQALTLALDLTLTLILTLTLSLSVATTYRLC